jgi:membrane protein DedA with SNARE-associated domain
MAEWLATVREVLANLHAGYFPDLGVWSYVVLAVLVATEGPLSTLLGAAAAAAGILDVRLVFVATVAGNVVGDTFWYSLGYRGKTSWLMGCGRWLGLEERHLARLVREMHNHAAKLIVFAKLAYGLIVPTLVAAGMARVKLRRWFPVVFVVETLWSLLLVWVGFHATGFIAEFEQGMQIVGMVVLVVVAGALFWLIKRRIERKELELDPLLQGHMELVTIERMTIEPVTETFGDDWDALMLDGGDDEARSIQQVAKGQVRADRAVHVQRLGQWL